jgi:hypothetical protein
MELSQNDVASKVKASGLESDRQGRSGVETERALSKSMELNDHVI